MDRMAERQRASASFARRFFAPMAAATVFAVVCGPGASADERCFRFVVANVEPHPTLAKNVAEAFDQADLCYSFEYVPKPVATEKLLSGQVDGEMFRVKQYRKRIGDKAVIVPTPIVESDGRMMPFDQRIDSLDGLKGGRFGAVAGRIWARGIAAKNGLLVEVASRDELLNRFNQGEFDAILFSGTEKKVVEKITGKSNSISVIDIAPHIFLSSESKTHLRIIENSIANFRARKARIK